MDIYDVEMDFSNTFHVRIYTEITPTAKLWGFFGRMLMDALVQSTDRAGVIALADELREDPEAALAVAIDCPDVQFVRDHLPQLLLRGSVRWTKDGEALVVENYHMAQYGNMQAKLSRRLLVAKRRATERAIEQGWIEPPFWWDDTDDTDDTDDADAAANE